ncbi:MAG: squalene--hopene cyclase [Alphaproteobacteria bacterium]|nr:squalene--hopene cyclase [Alphaproteobacteria bacterium]MBV8549027.1 squalene--hopene cyclase [Alphaproteobacteria bacterium]
MTAPLAAVMQPTHDRLQDAIKNGTDDLLSQQRPDGHWVFELEADATIPAEYILLDHFLGTVNQPLHERMAYYLREIQEEHGGWPLFHRGELNISASVKAYYALKCVGDAVDAPHMVRARKAILAAGGAEKSNVFTRIQMALFGAVPWHAVPVMPVEIMLLPRWFPFHLSKISYWSRTVIVPLLILMTKKPMARNPRRVFVDELFVTPPSQVKNWNSNTTRSIWNPVFRWIDNVLRLAEPHMPTAPRRKAMDKCVAWVKERLNGEDGLGGIYPAMANAVMMYDVLNFDPQHPDAKIARRSVEKLVVDDGVKRAYCQPCLSPIWDTGLATHAMLDAGADETAIRKACDWLVSKQILDVVGDWAEWRPGVRPGGWAFQYANDYYPDVDDTAVVVMALDRVDRNKYAHAIERAAHWILGLQSKNGGWGAFDADNIYYYLNHIPFADHGALLDPPSADVTARCLSMLAQLSYSRQHPNIVKAVDYLRREQEPEGCWFGRWGTNYIYGTWSVLCALNAIGIDRNEPMVRRAVDWLVSKQRADGGWGENGESYWTEQPKGECAVSTPSQTAWAVLGLMAAGEVDHEAVAKGIAYLQATQNAQGQWREEYYTAVGFPRVFYLRYHGYKSFFPTWALARYHNLKQGNATQVMHGM